MPLPREATGSCYLRLEYRRQMEIAVVGATAVLTLDGSRVADARVAITALAPTIRRVPAAEAALLGTDAGRPRPERRHRLAADGGRADLRRPRLGALPAGDGRGHHPARDRDRRRARARRGRAHPRELRAPRSVRLEGRGDAARERDRLSRRGRPALDPAAAPCASRSVSPDRRRAATTPSAAPA